MKNMYVDTIPFCTKLYSILSENFLNQSEPNIHSRIKIHIGIQM